MTSKIVQTLAAATLVTVAACGQAEPSDQPKAEPPTEQHPITKDIGTGVEVSITLALEAVTGSSRPAAAVVALTR